MTVIAHLMKLERRLALGRGPEYAEILADDAMVVVPGAVLDKGSCIEAMDASPGWDRVELGTPRAVVREGLAAVIYDFTGWRSETRYEAVLVSTYVEDDDGWHLLLHQQTPAA